MAQHGTGARETDEKKEGAKGNRGRQTAVQRSILLAFRPPRHGIIGSIRIKAGLDCEKSLNNQGSADAL